MRILCVLRSDGYRTPAIRWGSLTSWLVAICVAANYVLSNYLVPGFLPCSPTSLIPATPIEQWMGGLREEQLFLFSLGLEVHYYLTPILAR